MPRRMRSEHEDAHIFRREANYTCGLCNYSYRGPLEVWLPLRDLHWEDAHPGFTPRKRKRHSIPGLNRNVRYEDEKELTA